VDGIVKLVAEGHIQVNEGDNPLVKLAEHFAAQGCKEFAIEDGALYLRWPDGREQKITIDEGMTLQ
jgi:hypothetical protein